MLYSESCIYLTSFHINHTFDINLNAALGGIQYFIPKFGRKLSLNVRRGGNNTTTFCIKVRLNVVQLSKRSDRIDQHEHKSGDRVYEAYLILK